MTEIGRTPDGAIPVLIHSSQLLKSPDNDSMLKVLFTVDTEIWCGGWQDLDARFPDAYRRYVYGPTSGGDYALPGLFRILDNHGLKGVFMVESLFAERFGIEPLAEMIGLINDAGHEVQLHVHPEWVDEAKRPVLSNVSEKRPWIRRFDLSEQITLIAQALANLRRAGAPDVRAFRAGSYALNTDTLRALKHNGITMDTSYNPGYSTGVDDVAPGELLMQPESIEGVTVFPVTAFRERGGASLRHLQLTACSFAETRKVLDEALDAGYGYVVMVAHNFELLTPDKRRADRVVVRRFEKICRYLADNPERFQVCGFNDVDHVEPAPQPPPVSGNAWLVLERQFEQALRRLN